MQKKNGYSTLDISREAGIALVTVYDWLKRKKFPEPARDRNNKRVFTEEEFQAIIKYALQRRPPKK